MSWLNEYPTKVDIIMKISTRLYSWLLLFALQCTQLIIRRNLLYFFEKSLYYSVIR